MAKILDVLVEFLHEVEKDNPCKLIGKGGTILSLFYLNRHRESEDLDFDTTLGNNRHREIEAYLISILERLKNRGLIKEYSKGKSGLAATNRYHMNLALKTYKTFHTKIDVDFVRPVKNLEKKGMLLYYPIERLFIGKLVAFVERKEFKDIYDVAHMLQKIDVDVFRKNPNVAALIVESIKAIEGEEILPLYKKAFRNVDLRFKSLQGHDIDEFAAKIIRDLLVLKNKIS